jgi:hypothetical protein
MKRPFVWVLGIVFVLLVYGAFRFPSALRDLSGLTGDLVILITYGLAFQVWFSHLETRAPEVMQAGWQTGLVIGVVFVTEIVLEYVLAPSDNSLLGIVEYGCVFAIILLISAWIAYQTGKFKNGLFTAILGAMIGSMIWLMAILLLYYVFYGTTRQTQVFRAEGTFEDFARSGMTDFDAFAMQDFWGAGFFHSILLPLLAAILGSVGSLLGISLAGLWNRS